MIMLFMLSLMFAAVFSLYELPLESVLYAALLCFAVGAVMFILVTHTGGGGHRDLKSLSAVLTALSRESAAPCPTARGGGLSGTAAGGMGRKEPRGYPGGRGAERPR